MAAKKILMLGVGNPFRRDDGIGPVIIRRLQAEPPLMGIDWQDGGADGFTLLDYLPQYEQVVLIDAVEMGATPGDVKVLTPAEARLKVQADALSTHGFGLAEALALIERLGLQTDLRIIGVQVKDVRFGEGLSPEVALKIEDILTLVKAQIAHE